MNFSRYVIYLRFGFDVPCANWIAYRIYKYVRTYTFACTERKTDSLCVCVFSLCLRVFTIVATIENANFMQKIQYNKTVIIFFSVSFSRRCSSRIIIIIITYFRIEDPLDRVYAKAIRIFSCLFNLLFYTAFD